MGRVEEHLTWQARSCLRWQGAGAACGRVAEGSERESGRMASRARRARNHGVVAPRQLSGERWWCKGPVCVRERAEHVVSSWKGIERRLCEEGFLKPTFRLRTLRSEVGGVNLEV